MARAGAVLPVAHSHAVVRNSARRPLILLAVVTTCPRSPSSPVRSRSVMAASRSGLGRRASPSTGQCALRSSSPPAGRVDERSRTADPVMTSHEAQWQRVGRDADDRSTTLAPSRTPAASIRVPGVACQHRNPARPSCDRPAGACSFGGVAGRRAQLPVAADAGRGRHRPRHVGGLGSAGRRDRPARAGRSQPMVQPALAAADRLRAAARRGRGRQGPARRARRCSGSSGATRARWRRSHPERRRAFRPGRGGSTSSTCSSWSSSSAPGSRSCPTIRGCTGPGTRRPGRDWFRIQKPVPAGPAVDGQAGLDQPPGPGRPAGTPPLDRPGALVASGRRRAVAAQRRGLLRPAVRDRPVAAAGADQLGRVPQRPVGADPVPLAELAGRERLGRPTTACS